MRFWVITILSTVFIAAAVTWLTLHSEGQGDASAVIVDRPVTPETSGEMEFDGTKAVANVLELDGGTSYLGQANHLDVPFRNVGKGPLTIQLVRTNCGCGHVIAIDGQPLEINKTVITKGPGEAGALRLEWTPKINQLSEGTELRLSANFLINDPRPQFVNGLRFEIKTQVRVPRKEIH